MKTSFLFILIACSILFSCKKSSDPVLCNTSTTSKTELKITGKIFKQGFTYHQYGSHYIIEDSVYFALTSDQFDLDSLVGIDTTLIGNKISGYPINVGIDPDYIKVTGFE